MNTQYVIRNTDNVSPHNVLPTIHAEDVAGDPVGGRAGLGEEGYEAGHIRRGGEPPGGIALLRGLQQEFVARYAAQGGGIGHACADAVGRDAVMGKFGGKLAHV